MRHNDDARCGAGISGQAVRSGVEAALGDGAPKGAVVAGYEALLCNLLSNSYNLFIRSASCCYQRHKRG
jgi:hypothetical protein